MSTKIITQKEDWDFLVNSCESSDFYHTFDYHELSKNCDEKPVLIIYEKSNELIAIPLLVRKVKNTKYLDATSVYGYSGPISNNISSGYNNASFKNAFNELLIEHNVVSVFSRLNPYIPFQENILENIGNLEYSGKIVNIDINKSLEQQKKGYNKRFRTYINKSRRLCYIEKAKSESEVREFINIYYENMKRVNAKNNYFFKEDYFFNLLKCNSFKAEIFLAKCKEHNETIAGALFVKKNGIVQYHLAGSKNDYLHYNAIKLLIDEMRIQSSIENNLFFNLGGGVSSQDDSLLHFKSGFSKNYRDFKLWKYIVNPEIYNNLILQKSKKTCVTSYEVCNAFFPCYRCEK